MLLSPSTIGSLLEDESSNFLYVCTQRRTNDGGCVAGVITQGQSPPLQVVDSVSVRSRDDALANNRDSGQALEEPPPPLRPRL